MQARDFYIRVTNRHGASTVREHRVWDADRFLRSQQDQYSKDEKDPCTVTVATQAEYRAQRKGKTQ